jgi:hypothetical protein
MQDFNVIERQPGVRIIDRTLDRALLISATDDAVQRLRAALPHWAIEEEKVLSHPS